MVSLSSKKPMLETKEKIQNIDTKTSFIIKSENDYKELFDQTKASFKGSLILKNKNGRLFPKTWSGHIDTNLDATKQIANLNDFSIFKILGKGHAYHGFVVDTESNKKFFNSAGWPNYPKHVTAIPIKNEEDQLEFVFIGFAIRSLDRQSIQNIERQVLDYFSDCKSKKLAA